MNRYAQFYALTKPRVVQLIVFCAVIGMVLAIPGLPSLDQLRVAGLALASVSAWALWMGLVHDQAPWCVTP